MSKGNLKGPLLKFNPSYMEELMSWIKSSEDLGLWSGNTFMNGFDRKSLLKHLGRADLFSFCKKNHFGKLLCYGEVVATRGDTATLCRIIVNPESRRVGLGKKFCKELIEWTQKNPRIRKISLNTLLQNSPAIHCYRSLGFKIRAIKRRSRKINGKWKDLVIMSMVF